MKALISVEGPTEETFVRTLLSPQLQDHGLWLVPIIVKTRPIPGRTASRGGHIPYTRIKKELLGLLEDTSAIAVTTMYDVYALPRDFPGYETGPQSSGSARVSHLEAALGQDIAHLKFFPYLQLYEF